MIKIIKFLFGVTLYLLFVPDVSSQTLVGSSDQFKNKTPKPNQFVARNVNFSWNKLDSAVTYNLVVTEDTVVNNLVANSLENNNSIVLPLNFGTFFWKVYALDGNNLKIDSTQYSSFTIFSIKSVPNLNLWLNGDSVITNSSSNVTTWLDQSNFQRQVSQGSVIRQPLLNNNVINGYATVDFDVTRKFFLNVATINDSDYYVGTVYNFHEPVGRACRLLTGSSNWVLGPYLTHSLTPGVGFTGNGEPIVQDRFVLNSAFAEKSNQSLTHLVNNVIDGVSPTYRLPSILNIGANSGDFFNGSVAEIVTVNGFISKQLVDSIEVHLMDKYAPPISLPSDTLICNFPYQIDLSSNSYSQYIWNDTLNSNLISINTPGLYKVEVTDIFNRKSVDSIYVGINNIDYNLELPNDTVLCAGDSIVITINAPDVFGYSWNDGLKNGSRVIRNSGFYKLIINKCNGLVLEDSIRVTFNDVSFDLGLDTSICFNDSIRISPNVFHSNVGYLWNNLAIDSFVIAKQSGIYILEVIDSEGCNFTDSIALISDSSIFSISLGNDTTLCIGNQISLIKPLNINASYLWNNSITDSILVVSNSGQYFVDVSLNQCVSSDTINVVIKGQAPVVSFNSSKFCFGDSTQFINSSIDPNSISFKSFRWDFGGGDSSLITSPNFQFDSAGIYNVSLQVTNDSGCVGSVNQNVEIFKNPNASFRVLKSCELDSTNFVNNTILSNGNIANYLWDFGVFGIGDTSILMNPSFVYNSGGSYTVQLKVVDTNSCVDSSSITLIVNPKPAVQFSFTNPYVEDTTVFQNLSAISSGSIINYVWNFGNDSTSNLVNPIQIYDSLGSYIVNLVAESDSGCFDNYADTIDIVVKPPPEPIFNTIYPNSNQLLKSVSQFKWNRKDSAESYIFELSQFNDFSSKLIDTTVININYVDRSITERGKYYWRVTALSNNLRVDTTNIDSFRVFSPLMLDSVNVILNGDSIILDTNNKVLTWVNQVPGSINSTQTIASRRPSVIQNGLNGFDLIEFDISRSLMPAITDVTKKDYYISSVYNFHENNPRATRLITGLSTLSNWVLGPYSTHSITQGFIFIGSGIPIVKDKYVLNTAHATNDTIQQFVNNNYIDKGPLGNIPRILNVGSVGGDFMNGSVAEIIIANGGITDDERQLLDEYLLDKYAPKVDLGLNKILCSFPDSLTLNQDYITEVIWSTGDTSQSLMVVAPGLYTATITDIFDRTYIDSIFYILDTSNYKISFTSDTINSCLGSEVLVSAGTDNYSFLWNTMDTTSVISVNSTSLYSVSVQNCNNNTSTDSIFIQFNEPRFDLGIDTIVCFDGILQLQADSIFTNVRYQWSTNEISPIINANVSDVYSLQVTDQFNCKFSDTIKVTIDSSLFGVSLGVDTTLCNGNQIGLISSNNRITSYNWSTGDSSPLTLVDTSGAYKLNITSLRCSIADTLNVIIKGDAPIASFLSSDFCLEDSVKFTDQSTPPLGDTLKKWGWSFGNGDFSNFRNPQYSFSIDNNYKVLLAVETNRGCADTVSQIIKIEPHPRANFGIQSFVNCSKESIVHLDSSSISKGSITNYSWDFGDSLSSNNTSFLKDPNHTYDTTGNYLITLRVTSNKGCENSIIKNIFIHPKPNVRFEAVGICLSDSTKLVDQTVLAGGSVLDYLWAIDTNLVVQSNNPVTRLQNPTLKFNSTGKKAISLRVRSDKLCTSIRRDTITINESPIANFTVPIVCENDSIKVFNTSTSNDSIEKYEYKIDTSFLYNQNFGYLFNTSGLKPIILKVETINGCKDSIVKNADVKPIPKVDFSILNNNIGIPFNVSIINKTTGGNSYLWDFGNGDSSNLRVPNYTYQDTGRFKIKLTAKSNFGCTDSLTKEAYSLVQFLDASVSKLILSENLAGELEISTLILNSGFNTIYSLKLRAELNNEFQIIKNISDTIYRGESFGVVFDNLFLQSPGKKLDFVCLEIAAVNSTNDSIRSNNKVCERGFNNELEVKTYPNPVEGLLTVEYVLPDDGEVLFRVFDLLGREVLVPLNLSLEDGYYTNTFNTIELTPGLYLYNFTFNGISKTGTFLKR